MAERAAREAPDVAQTLYRRVTVGVMRLAATLPPPQTPWAPGHLVAAENTWLNEMVFAADWARATARPELAIRFGKWGDMLHTQARVLTAMRPEP